MNGGAEQNYPNPFNPITGIAYDIPKTSHVSLQVYDILGIERATLVNQKENPGSHRVSRNSADIPSRVYFCRSIAGDIALSQKMILAK